MTLRDQIHKLREEFQLRADALLAAEDQLFREGNGFFDKGLLDKLADARAAFVKAESEYQKLLSEIISKKPNIDAEI